MKTIIGFMLLLAGCNSTNQVEIKEASKDTLINIHTRVRYPTTLQLPITGKTND